MTAFERLIRAALIGWERHQRHKRAMRLRRSDRQYAAACERRDAERKAHGHIAEAQRQVSDAIHARLRMEVRHG